MGGGAKRLILLAAVTSALACAEKDTTAPAPPFLEEISSPNPQQELTVNGTAEFNATVTIRGGAGQAVTTTADPYTARFRARVSLNVGANTLSVTATDAAGNESAPATVEVEHILPGTPASIVITGPTSARAGEAVRFTVEVLDVFGNPVFNPTFTLTTDDTSGMTTFDPPATFTFCQVGTRTVTVDAGAGVTASTEIEILPGRAVALTLETIPSPAVVTAGQTVAYTTTPFDTCGNVTHDFVDVYTNAPGAIVGAGTISGLTRAGSWSIVAQVPGTAAADSASLLVNADESSVAVVLSLTAHHAFVGLPIGYSVTAVDGFGNPIAIPPIITTTDPGAVVDPVTATIVFAGAGVHTVTATVITPTGAFSDSDFVIVTDPDTAAPSVAITSPVDGTRFGGGPVLVIVEATDDRGLAQILFQASGADTAFEVRLVPSDPTTGLAPTSVTEVFTINIGGGAFGEIRLVAQAIDTTGNHSSSTPVVIIADPAVNIVTAAGFTIETIAGEGFLNGPRGLTVDGAGLVHVANNGSGTSVVRIDPAITPFANPFANQTAFVPFIDNPAEDIVFYPAGNTLFLTVRNAEDRIFRIDTAGIAQTFTASVGPGPAGIILDGGTTISALWRDGVVRTYNPTAAPFAAPLSQSDVDAPIGSPPWWGYAQVGSRYAATSDGNDEAWDFARTAVFGAPVISERLMAGSPPLNTPRDIVLAPGGGRFYVANEGDGRIVQIDVSTCTGSPCPTATIASGFNAPWGLAFDSAGRLLITDEADDLVFRMSGPF